MPNDFTHASKSALLFISRTWWGIGGMQTLSHDLYRAYADAYGEHAVHLCIPPDRSLFSRLIVFPLRALCMGILSSRRGVSVHLSDSSLCFLGFCISLFGKGKVTSTACGLDVIYRNPLYQWMIARCLPRLDTVVCISSATQKEVIQRGVERKKTIVIPCGVFPSQGVVLRKKNGKHPTLLSVCRLIERKGIHWFLSEVFPDLLLIHPDLRYIIVGDGKYTRKIKKCIRILGLQRNVSIRGSVSDIKRRSLYQSADVIVIPNIGVKGDMEGFGISCIEASSHGVQVAAARIEGLKDAVIEGKTGRFFSSSSHTDCKRIILDMLKNPLSRECVHTETLKTFNWSTLIETYREKVFRPVQRIGIVMWDSLPHPKGGLGRSMSTIEQTLKSKKKEVFVLSPHAHRLLTWTRYCPAGHILFSLLLPVTLQRWIDRYRITTVLAPVGPGGVLLLRTIKRADFIACVYHTYLQQSLLVPGQQWKELFIPLERRSLQSAKTLFCYSPDTQEILIEKMGCDSDRIILLPQILDCIHMQSSPRPKKESGLCVCIARLEKRKGVEDLLKSWEYVLEKNPAAKLILVGDGILRPLIERKIQSLSGVERYAHLPQQELLNLIQRASILISPSYLEGFGLAVAEAQCLGTAVIATQTHGHSSLVKDDETGWTVPPGNPQALAATIVYGLDHNDACRHICETAKRKALSRFHPAKSTTALLHNLR